MSTPRQYFCFMILLLLFLLLLECQDMSKVECRSAVQMAVNAKGKRSARQHQVHHQANNLPKKDPPSKTIKTFLLSAMCSGCRGNCTCMSKLECFAPCESQLLKLSVNNGINL
ncbi:uncharacterized protein LOC132743117 [Ruditapes philippinarum]|uniref:uncharacterized protein LOC132743117 n=1 Tax=Ruditapes philippinarum TaxID=129788 RepID=UPI00295AF821|nr:uncharacterized protein LOC132743117 [Ruditapes philippinarum]